MNPDPALLQALKDYKDQGISFYDAKQALLVKGYTDDQITYASAHAAPVMPSEPDIVKSTYQKDPELATTAAKTILLDDLQKRQRRIIGFDIDGLFGLFNTSSRRESFSLLGLPLGILFIVGLAVTALLGWLSFGIGAIPSWTVNVFLLAYFIFIAGFAIYRVLKLNKRIAKLADETQSPHAPHTVMTIVFILLVLAIIYLFISYLI